MLIPWAAVRAADRHIGLGVFASRPIAAGTVVWVEDALDLRIPADAVRGLESPMRDAVYRSAYRPLGADYYLLCWDGAKYANHSCDPNCLLVGRDVEIAVRDIAAGEQLTNHYAFFGLEPWEAFDCRCGASSCSGSVPIHPDAAASHRWQDLVDAACRMASSVEQPLAPLLPADRIRGLARRGAATRAGARRIEGWLVTGEAP